MWLSCLLCCVFMHQSPLLRISYDLQFFEGDNVRHGKLTLNWQDDAHFSLHCSAAPAGGLFTFWATETENILEIPREKAFFKGNAREAFQLLPEGPLLTRAEWLQLFRDGKLVSDEWKVADGGGAFILYSAENKPLFRWSERGRSEKKEYNEQVLEPRTHSDFSTHSFARLVELWKL